MVVALRSPQRRGLLQLPEILEFPTSLSLLLSRFSYLPLSLIASDVSPFQVSSPTEPVVPSRAFPTLGAKPEVSVAFEWLLFPKGIHPQSPPLLSNSLAIFEKSLLFFLFSISLSLSSHHSRVPSPH